MTDLLTIPAFLRIGSPEREEAVERGGVNLTANPRPFHRKAKDRTLIPKPVKRAKNPRCTEATRIVLHVLGWSDKVIDRLSPKTANQIADAGRKMQPTDEVQSLRGTL